MSSSYIDHRLLYSLIERMDGKSYLDPVWVNEFKKAMGLESIAAEETAFKSYPAKNGEVK